MCAQAEWCLPDRRLHVPLELDILLAAKRLVEFTAKQPHLELGFSEEARERFDSYGVMFNTRSNQLRKGADADAAAEEGAIELLHCLVCAYVTAELYMRGYCTHVYIYIYDEDLISYTPTVIHVRSS